MNAIECSVFTFFILWAVSLLALGSFPISQYLYIRYGQKKISFVTANVICKAVISILLFLNISSIPIFICDTRSIVLSIILGLFFSYIIIASEEGILRRYNRKRLTHKKARNTQHDPIEKNKEYQRVIAFGSSTRNITFLSARKSFFKFAKPIRLNYYSFCSIILIAVLEEYLFRGQLIYFLKTLSNLPLLLCIFLINIIFFVCSHLAKTWLEVMTKIPLAIVTSCTVLSGSLWSAIVIHIFFNVYVYFSHRRFA